MRNILRSYARLQPHILSFIAGELMIQMINTAFLVILLIYMGKCGYQDHESAGFLSLRFLGVLVLAFPLGLYIKGRKIKPVLLYGAFTIPIFSLLIVYAIYYHISWLLYISQLMWGLSFLCFQVTALPYILRNSPQEQHTEAISLSFATYSFAGIISGIFIFALSKINSQFFDERTILSILSVLGFFGIFFIARIKTKEEIIEAPSQIKNISQFDWRLIFKALIPTIIISTGAGLTIPFIGIFFYNIHGFNTDKFSVFAAVAAVLVAISAILVPSIKKKYTYQLAVPATQSVAVVALFILASTEFFKDYMWASYIAVFCYLIRQPLMNMAAPMTSEIVMNYVGEKNREIVSALTTAIWSGAWFISSRIFKVLRENDFAYANVFYITATMYGIGVIWYYFLIRDYNRKEK
jgi:predicted MFS family arabinose efflux permease